MLAAMEALLARKRRRWPGVPSGRADLHAHSIWSDGAQHPDDIVRAAAGRVEVVAVIDHDEIRGAQRARAFALDHPDLGVDVVVGEEISTLNDHLIGLYLSERFPPGLSADETIELIRLTEIDASALLVWGKDDRITPPEVAERSQTLLPDSRLIFLPCCGHAPMLEQADAFNEAVAVWLMETRDRRGAPVTGGVR